MPKTGYCYECGGQWLWTRNAYNHKPGCSRGHPAYYSDREQEEHAARAKEDEALATSSELARAMDEAEEACAAALIKALNEPCPHHGYSTPAYLCPGCEDAAEQQMQAAYPDMFDAGGNLR